MLYAPDTVLRLYLVDVNEHTLPRTNSFSVSQNYPHPFIGQTSIDVFIEKADDIEIRIFDLLGREHASFEGVFEAGKHTFMFSPGNESFYFFSASYCGLTRSIKITNPISGVQNCKLTYKGFMKPAGSLKSYLDINFPFSFGDELRYIGYSETTAGIRGSDVIEDVPESNETYIFDITEGIPCIDVPTVFYQLQLYNTVQIGSQCWLKESLNTGTMIMGALPQMDNGTIEKYCFDDDPANCITYGGLYQWGEAMNYTIQAGAQGVCPPGWHIPTDEEWKQLEGEVDTQYGYPDPVWDSMDYRGFDVGERLKANHTWNYNGNGTDYFGFSALATGARRFDGAFLSIGIYSGIWSSTEGSSSGPWYRFMEYWSPQVSRTHNLSSMGRPVRCLRDE